MAVEQLIKHFEQQVGQGTLSHAYLFSGNDYAGKKTLTQAIVQALVCEQPTATNQSCLQCEMCERVAAGQFADMMVVQPEGHYIKVDQIRQLKSWLGQTPIESTFKVAVIEKAEAMNASAANALLTFLEEPVANVYILLYVNDVEAVLPTIRSRAQQIHVYVQHTHQRINALEEAGVMPHHARMMNYFEEESIAQWREQYDATAFEQWYKNLHLLYRKLLQGDATAFVMMQTHLKGNLSVQQGLDGLAYYLGITNELLKAIQLNQIERLSTTFLQELVQETQPSIARLLSMHRAFFEAQRLMNANVSPQMSYESIAIELGKWQ